MKEGGGERRSFEGGVCLTLWLMEGWALIITWALIRGNAVYIYIYIYILKEGGCRIKAF